MSSTRPLPATAHVVLGLASIRPTTGHGLAAFSERSIGNFFPIARSQVYLELDRLCRDGLLDVTEVVQDRRPTKRIYEITRSGVGAVVERLAGRPEAALRRATAVFGMCHAEATLDWVTEGPADRQRGTAASVLIDAFAIRSLLVPSLMGLLGSANWWSLRPLRRLHDRIGLAD